MAKKSFSVEIEKTDVQVKALTNLSTNWGFTPEHQGILQTGGDSLPNPLKTAVAGQSDPPNRRIDHGAYQTLPHTRRAKALSSPSFTLKHPHSDHNATSSREPDWVNKRTGSRKRLFDPVQDKATAVSTLGKNEKGKRPLPFCRVYEPQTCLSPSKADVQIEEAPHGSHLVNQHGSDMNLDPGPELLLQPETRPISREQLVLEVKGIYAGLVMVEAKCINVENMQAVATLEKEAWQTKLTPEQWQALIALHKTLLHEHHDFFLASQHSSASLALSRLAAKYSMPAKMWRHGIHAFLEVLRHRLPHSLDHMLVFIYTAYSMMALPYEMVSAFKNTWIECLGDLGRYRMAIKNDDIKDREVWSGVARFWYEKAANKSSNTGRFYHHLATLARPYTLQQLSLYTRSLTCIIPFKSSKASIMTLFSPILDGKESAYYKASSVETIFIKAHALLFTGGSTLVYNECIQQLCSGVFDNYIGRITAKFKEQGVFAALSNISSLFEYGALAVDGTKSFPKPNEGVGRPLPEDFVMRGPSIRRSCYPKSTRTAESRKRRNYGLPVQRGRSSWLYTLALMAIAIKPILALEHIWEYSHLATGMASVELDEARPSATDELVTHSRKYETTANPTLVPGSAFTIETLTASESSSNYRSVDLNVPPLPNWAFPLLCVTVVTICWLIAILNQWEPIQVSGTFTGVAWWLWLYLKQDPNTSPWVSWPLWCIGTATLVVYSRCGFKDLKSSNSYAFFNLVTAFLLAFLAAKFVPDLRIDILSAFPPCFGIGLTFYMVAIPPIINVWKCSAGYLCGIATRLRVPWHSSEGARLSASEESRRLRQLEDGLRRSRSGSLPA